MAFRRSSNFRRRFGSSRFRSRRLHRAVTPTKKYNAAPFFFQTSLDLSDLSLGSTLTMIHLASIPLSLQSQEDEAVGTVLGEMRKGIDIGGIVFDYGSTWFDVVDGDRTTADGIFWENWSLVTDRIVTELSGENPIPAALNRWDPFTSSWPTALFVPAVDTPTDQSEAYAGPTRVHWQHTDMRNRQPRTLVDADNETLYFAAETGTSPRSSTLSKRLRIRLDATQGLYFCYATRTGPNWIQDPSNRGQLIWVKGTLYYRTVQ